MKTRLRQEYPSRKEGLDLSEIKAYTNLLQFSTATEISSFLGISFTYLKFVYNKALFLIFSGYPFLKAQMHPQFLKFLSVLEWKVISKKKELHFLTQTLFLMFIHLFVNNFPYLWVLFHYLIWFTFFYAKILSHNK